MLERDDQQVLTSFLLLRYIYSQNSQAQSSKVLNSTHNQQPPPQVTVLAIDYGWTTTLPCTLLYKLTPEEGKMSPGALLCRLNAVYNSTPQVSSSLKFDLPLQICRSVLHPIDLVKVRPCPYSPPHPPSSSGPYTADVTVRSAACSQGQKLVRYCLYTGQEQAADRDNDYLR